MSTTSGKPGAEKDPQREQLDRSFERATEQEPQEYRNKSSGKKQVEIGSDKTDEPIKGMDAPETPGER